MQHMLQLCGQGFLRPDVVFKITSFFLWWRRFLFLWWNPALLGRLNDVGFTLVFAEWRVGWVSDEVPGLEMEGFGVFVTQRSPSVGHSRVFTTVNH